MLGNVCTNKALRNNSNTAYRSTNGKEDISFKKCRSQILSIYIWTCMKHIVCVNLAIGKILHTHNWNPTFYISSRLNYTICNRTFFLHHVLNYSDFSRFCKR